MSYSPFDDKPATSTQEFWDANGFRVEAGTNCPRGGDSGHGGRTFLGLTSLAGTDWEIRVRAKGREISFTDLDAFEIALGGDAECRTLVQALEFAVSALRRGMDDGRA